ncbi:MAG: hypothetical protein A2831_03625 [Candidatus Yanofskybacteria bacterium RIFCSPHIGHO2_01_FULL_44_17]|uniref:Uncharacterized protein n=1 Tax=Candidatus Yanofskybacteria bacterium RIFCSPHIGHO2_01_FULL_44_17 TaxID=1802668 RepID=A0A1F8EXZ9_9BACT|nr:MAG: hypothetical protein A2831_03625 [Candidatus Yanofskybacteria bacterium RIFCSPHIGHO2_01_FULL_44_17]
MVARSIQLKDFLDEAISLRINDHLVIKFVIEIASWCYARIFASSDFLSQSTLHILREIIYIVLGLPKRNIEHEFALRGWLKPKGAEF